MRNIAFPFLFAPRRTLLALILLCATPGWVNAQCKPGDILIGEDADSYICKDKGQYEASAAYQMGKRFCQAKGRVAASQGAIKALGFATDAERFELYADIAQAQKAEFEHRILGALFDQGLNATQLAVDSASSLNPVNVNQAIEVLEKNGLDDATVVAALKYVASQSGKPAKAAAYRMFVQRIKGAKESWETRPHLSGEVKNENLKIAVGALKILQGNPYLGLIITGAKFGENIAYLFYLTGRLNDLAAESDAHLTRLHELTESLKGQVAASSEAKAKWRQATGYQNATPTCD